MNLTPFVADRFIAMGGDGRESLLVVVKATFSLAGRTAALADEQAPLVLADEYTGEPGKSSLAQASDVAPFKPAADLLLSGCAYTKKNERTEATVGLRVAGLQKAVRVVGDRTWQRFVGLTEMSASQPFLKMPLVYEHAFGGTDETGEKPTSWAANPVGRGFRAKGSKLPTAGAHLPNLEDPREPMRGLSSQPPTVGFGPLAPGWAPRPRYAGTYDGAWQEARAPLLPKDFDPRFHQVAPADQILSGYIRGGESVVVVGVRPEGAGLSFTLPAVRPRVVVNLAGRRETPACPCDTMALDCERETVSLTWRASLDVQGQVPGIYWIKIEQAA